MNKTIHRVWLGSEMPEDFKQYGEEWKDLNPDWELHDWTDEEIFDTEWINQPVIDKMIEESKDPRADMIAFYTHVVDVIDYEIMYKHGGLYINTDIKPIKPLSVLGIAPELPALAMEDDVHPVNMAMYSPVEDPFFARVIEFLPRRYWAHPKAGMHITTGVHLLVEALAEYQQPVALWPRDVWNPIHWANIPYGTKPDLDIEYPECTVASHFWTHRYYMRGAEVLP